MHLKTTRNYLKNKFQNSPIFNNYEVEQQQIINLIKVTILSGESNSGLIIGPGGNARNILLKSVFEQLEDSVNVSSNAIIVRLNGLIHTNDSLAIKSCMQQMNFAGKVWGTFGEYLAFLRDCLQTGERQRSKCLIFILDELDLFCTHNNQTLLYNLLDLSHNGQTPVSILGFSSRFDVVDLFEKRIKSRFSHRIIHLLPQRTPIETQLKQLETLLTIAEEVVGDSSWRKEWNAHISQLVNEPRFGSAIGRLAELTTCEQVFRNIFLLWIFELNSVSTPKLTADSLIKLIEEYERGHKADALNSLTVLEMSLVIAMRHHSDIYDCEPFNFQMIFDRYKKFAQANAVHKGIAFKAFQHIQHMEFIGPVANTRARCQKEYELFELLLRPEQIMDAFQAGAAVPTEVKQWLCAAPT